MELSDKARELFEDSNILFVGTVNADGSPQSRTCQVYRRHFSVFR